MFWTFLTGGNHGNRTNMSVPVNKCTVHMYYIYRSLPKNNHKKTPSTLYLWKWDTVFQWKSNTNHQPGFSLSIYHSTITLTDPIDEVWQLIQAASVVHKAMQTFSYLGCQLPSLQCPFFRFEYSFYPNTGLRRLCNQKRQSVILRVFANKSKTFTRPKVPGSEKAFRGILWAKSYR